MEKKKEGRRTARDVCSSTLRKRRKVGRTNAGYLKGRVNLDKSRETRYKSQSLTRV